MAVTAVLIDLIGDRAEVGLPELVDPMLQIQHLPTGRGSRCLWALEHRQPAGAHK